jgi:hypothetical protein
MPRLLQEESDGISGANVWADVATEATIFDCRKLPASFIIDTGQAVVDEEVIKSFRLPYKECYFEFDTVSVLAFEGFADENNEKFVVHFRLIASANDVPPTTINNNEIVHGLFMNGNIGDSSALGYCNHDDNDEDHRMEIDVGAFFLTGVLTLLNERLIATEVKPDPAPALTKARAKKGLPPITTETRVLTINVAAVRRVVARTKLQSHESPRLHWRRGHWRVLHRFSEFEDRVWVRRCLVGDPDRGFVEKDYRLIWAQPMLQ